MFNLNRWWDAKDPNRFGKGFPSFQDYFGGFKGSATTLIKDIAKVDDSTIRITLTRPYGTFPSLLALNSMGIASPTAIKQQGAKYGTPASQPVGTGPFIFESWTPGDRLTFKPNPNYWGTKSKLDKLIIRIIKDPSARLNELRAGTIDVGSNMNISDVKIIKSDKGLQILPDNYITTFVYGLNVEHPALSNVKVRQAVSIAFDKAAIIDSVYGEFGISDASFMVPVLQWADSKSVPKEYKYDPTAAKKMLADAGFPNGFAMDLWYPPTLRQYKDMAEGIASELSAIGIKVNLRTEDWAKFLEDRQNGKFDSNITGWSNGLNDPSEFYSTWFLPVNSTDIKLVRPSFAQAVLQGQAATTKAKRAAVYSKLHEEVYNSFVRVPLAHIKPLTVAKANIKGYPILPFFNGPVFNNITVDDK